jgi:lipopolysaccharide assembly outer membrane protein LptD (OstA)
MIEFLMKKVLLGVLSIVLFGSIILMLRSGREFSSDLQIKGGSFIEDVKILQKKDGTTVWTINAKTAMFSEEGDSAELNDIHMLLQKNGVELHADKGIYNLSERSFTTDSIVQAHAKDYKITADAVDYDVSSGRIRTDGKIKIEGKGFKVEGKGMKSDTGQRVTILHDVTATFNK